MSTAPKAGPSLPQRSSISPYSSPGAEADPDGQEPPQAQRRKGGRKPIYATSEERKQRNRQAQAAFRERRTEYIKQLEITIKHHEEALQSLQHNHRTAADECLMLRYKNSLLERILLEKGIDVQAELQFKDEGAVIRPVQSATTSSTGAVSAVPRGSSHRIGQFGRRQPQGKVPKLDTTAKDFTSLGDLPNTSAHSQAMSPSFPTPTSSYQSPMAINQQGGHSAPGRQPPRASHPPQHLQAHSPHSSALSPNPKHFQLPRGSNAQDAHYQQLTPRSEASFSRSNGDHPYPGGPADSMERSSGHGHEERLMTRHGSNASFQQPLHSHSLNLDEHSCRAITGHQNRSSLSHVSSTSPGQSSLYANDLLMDHDHAMDADPFGLSASMHFPTHF